MKQKIVDVLLDACEAHDSCGRHDLVAAIVDKNQIVSLGFNSYRKTHPLQRKTTRNENKIFLHAEVDAIDKAIKRIGVDKLRYTDIYVVRRRSDGSNGCAKPCEHCEDLIARMKIRRVFHT